MKTTKEEIMAAAEEALSALLLSGEERGRHYTKWREGCAILQHAAGDYRPGYLTMEILNAAMKHPEWGQAWVQQLSLSPKLDALSAATVVKTLPLEMGDAE